MVRDRQHHAHKCRIERERERVHKQRQRKKHMLTHYMLRARGVIAGEDNTQKLKRMERDRDTEMT